MFRRKWKTIPWRDCRVQPHQRRMDCSGQHDGGQSWPRRLRHQGWQCHSVLQLIIEIFNTIQFTIGQIKIRPSENCAVSYSNKVGLLFGSSTKLVLYSRKFSIQFLLFFFQQFYSRKLLNSSLKLLTCLLCKNIVVIIIFNSTEYKFVCKLRWELSDFSSEDLYL